MKSELIMTEAECPDCGSFMAEGEGDFLFGVLLCMPCLEKEEMLKKKKLESEERKIKRLKKERLNGVWSLCNMQF